MLSMPALARGPVAALLLLSLFGAFVATNAQSNDGFEINCPSEFVSAPSTILSILPGLPTAALGSGWPLSPGKCCPPGRKPFDLTFDWIPGTGTVYPEETRWYLVDDNSAAAWPGNVVYQRECALNNSGTGCTAPFRGPIDGYYSLDPGPVTEGHFFANKRTTYTERLCLSPGQYTLKIGDSYEDGLGTAAGSSGTISVNYPGGPSTLPCKNRAKTIYTNDGNFGLVGYGPPGSTLEADIRSGSIFQDYTSGSGLPGADALTEQVIIYPSGFDCTNNKCAGGCPTKHDISITYGITPSIVGVANSTKTLVLKKNGRVIWSRNDLWRLDGVVKMNDTHPFPFDDSTCLGEGAYELTVTDGAGTSTESVMLPPEILISGPETAAPSTGTSPRVYTWRICPAGEKFNVTTSNCTRDQEPISCDGGWDLVQVNTGGVSPFPVRVWPDEKFCDDIGDDVVDCGTCSSCREATSQILTDNNTDTYWSYANGTRAEIALDLLALKRVLSIRYKNLVAGAIKGVIVSSSIAPDCGYKNRGVFTLGTPTECSGDQTCQPPFAKLITTNGTWSEVSFTPPPQGTAFYARYLSIVFIVGEAGSFKLAELDVDFFCG